MRVAGYLRNVAGEGTKGTSCLSWCQFISLHSGRGKPRGPRVLQALGELYPEPSSVGEDPKDIVFERLKPVYDRCARKPLTSG